VYEPARDLPFLSERKIMKKIISIVSSMALAASFLLPLSAGATAPTTAPGQNKLLCFDGPSDGTIYGGKCTLKSNGAKGPATLDNTDSNVNGDYSGVYIQNTTITGQTLGNITQLGYNYSGNISPLPGNLSLNVPVDTDGNSMNDAYLFIDAYYCPGNAGAVDVIHDAVCGIWVNGIEYANWAALVAAHRTWTVAAAGENFTGTLPFVIAERTPSEPSALWTVSNVTLGKGGK